MIEKIYNLSRVNNFCRMKVEKKSKKEVEFESIVKFLNDQKAVIDYAGLN